MLTYAFDLLYAIYEEEGYEPAEIPENILTNNLHGIEIDERAGELAAFALTMKARSRSRRFFRRPVKPNICVLENVKFDEWELAAVVSDQWPVASGASREDILHDLNLFEEADNFGSLLRPRLNSEQYTKLRDYLTGHWSLATNHSLFDSATHQKVLQALRQADYLSPKYHVVIANPPYMGGKGMNGRLAAWVNDNYPNSKSDLFAMFIERNLDLAQRHGAVAMITMQSWMFLSSFEALRARLLGQNTLLSMAHLGARAFDSIGGEVVSTTAFVLENSSRLDYKGSYFRLVAGNSEAEKNGTLQEATKNRNCGWFYRASASDFMKVPGNPIAYWTTPSFRSTYAAGDLLGNLVSICAGLQTGDNNRFLRLWFETSSNRQNLTNAPNADKKWFPYNKGGELRKWYGNREYLVNWEDGGKEIYKFRPRSVLRNPDFYFLEGITWSDITTRAFAARYTPPGCLFDVKGSSAFPPLDMVQTVLGLLNSRLANTYMHVLNPTVTFQVGDISRIPLMRVRSVDKAVNNLIMLSKGDWNSFETSWDFTSMPLLNPDYRQPILKATYQVLRAHWREMTLEMQRLEEENNRIFIEAYGLQDELTPEVPLGEITLTCNPHYRFGSGASEEEELEVKLLAETMKELVSYAVGCMFGRYSLDMPGLVLANQGETIEDYRRKLVEHRSKLTTSHRPLATESIEISFLPDENNVIPLLDAEWFNDDTTERFQRFLRVAFGEEHYEENLRFVEQSLNSKGKRNYTIRDYFLGEFYTDHVKRYKKRPIYWLFSSPRSSFNALIYMHRYRPDTVSVVLNDYLREFRTKLTSHKNHLEAVSISASASQGEKTKALKEIEKIAKMIAEMEEYEREVLYPLATEQVEIDLDDGVKVNYPKLGAALKKIAGLDAKEDE